MTLCCLSYQKMKGIQKQTSKWKGVPSKDDKFCKYYMRYCSKVRVHIINGLFKESLESFEMVIVSQCDLNIRHP